MSSEYIAQLIIAALGGSSLGAVGLWSIQRFKLTHFKQIAEEILKKAEMDGDALKRAAEITLKQNLLDQQRELELQWQTEKRKAQREEDRLKQREDKLETRMNVVDKKLSDIEKRESQLMAQQTQLENEKKLVVTTQGKLIEQLEKAAGFSISEAKEYLIAQITNDVKTEAAHLIRRTKKEAEEEAENEANKIIATAINRLAVRCVSEATVNTVAIPNDEMKGRIIGREGRNIRALERATGINFIIDETPNAVVLSGFDPVRMQIAKSSLTELLKDGRIHPTRIEEVVEKTKQDIQKLIRQHGEDAALRAGAMNLHPDLIMLVGKLKFRYSYGQNILDHSLEVSHLMGIMAAELGLNVRLARRIGLLHDFGKAVSHEMEGSHAIIGHDLALKFGESKDVANGIGCHHYEMEATTIEGSLCSAADAISASRQGARSEPVEEYVTRLKKLEDLALEYPGVEKAYAMQAGREVRVIVVPELIDDDGVEALAKDLTQKIEKNLSYPGKIKVTIIREKRFVEYAV
ncbi:MAG: ribonuclease Y [Parachlamydiaceae bacterium]|nr:ribonuclease Y [Parachlamydiaceae bacterium]